MQQLVSGDLFTSNDERSSLNVPAGATYPARVSNPNTPDPGENGGSDTSRIKLLSVLQRWIGSDSNSRRAIEPEAIALVKEAARHDARVREEFLSVEQVAKRFHVSTKTVSRWSEQEDGLHMLSVPKQTFPTDANRVRVVPRLEAERFERENRQRVESAGAFRISNPVERSAMITRAKVLLPESMSLPELVQKLAKEFHRSIEMVRSVLRASEEFKSGLAVNPEWDRRAYDLYRQGSPIRNIAQRLHTSYDTAICAIARVRIADLKALQLDYQESVTGDYDRKGIEEQVFAPFPGGEGRTYRKKKNEYTGVIGALCGAPLLTKEQEQYLFRRYNYLKKIAIEELNRVQRPNATHVMETLDQIEGWVKLAVETRNHLITSNTRLAVSIAKKYGGDDNDFWRRVSDGCESLRRAVEKYDYSRDNKFSTYATWAIQKNEARSFSVEITQAARFKNGDDAQLGKIASRGNEAEHQPDSNERAVAAVRRVVDKLSDDRERKIIICRFGLVGEPMTLKEVGQELDITKERVRQIEARAMGKLKALLQSDPEALGVLEERFGSELIDSLLDDKTVLESFISEWHRDRAFAPLVINLEVKPMTRAEIKHYIPRDDWRRSEKKPFEQWLLELQEKELIELGVSEGRLPTFQLSARGRWCLEEARQSDGVVSYKGAYTA